MENFQDTSRGETHEKNLGAQIWVKWDKIRPKAFFCHFLKFGSLVFPEIAQNDSLEQFLTTIRGKTHEKNGKVKFGPNGEKLGPKLGFFTFFSSFAYQFSFKFYRMIAWNNI